MRLGTERCGHPAFVLAVLKVCTPYARQRVGLSITLRPNRLARLHALLYSIRWSACLSVPGRDYASDNIRSMPRARYDRHPLQPALAHDQARQRLSPEPPAVSLARRSIVACVF